MCVSVTFWAWTGIGKGRRHKIEKWCCSCSQGVLSRVGNRYTTDWNAIIPILKLCKGQCWHKEGGDSVEIFSWQSGKQGCSGLKKRMFKANRNHGLNLGGTCQECGLSLWPWAVHGERPSKSWQPMCSVKWASTRGCKCWHFILYRVSRSEHPYQALVIVCALRNSSYWEKTESFIQTRSKI